MIGYRISRVELRNRIDESWLRRANKRAKEIEKAGKYEESTSIWSEVKPVYMELQGNSKCAFCERKLESIDFGKGEQAVEHFRPKGNLKPWPVPAVLNEAGVRTASMPEKKGGYYRLAYDLFNYSAACIPCNSALKRDYFPVAGHYRLDGVSPEDLLDELPLLIYPIGDFDTDPEELIRFHGISPYAVAADGHDRVRGLVTIAFFKLDSPGRKNLLLERARVIDNLFIALRLGEMTSNRSDKELASAAITAATAAEAPHANCARCFCRLYESDPGKARSLATAAAAFVDSKSRR